MITIQYPNKFSGMLRPALSLAGCGGPVVKRVQEALVKVPKGTILVPGAKPDGPDRVDEPWSVWRYRAGWDADVSAYWFGMSSDQELKLVEFGLQIGRYCTGSGGSNLIVGTDKSCRFRGDLQKLINAANTNLVGTWKFELIDNLDTFCERIRRAVTK